MTDYGGGIHLVKAAFPFNGRDEDEVHFIQCYMKITIKSQIVGLLLNKLVLFV